MHTQRRPRRPARRRCSVAPADRLTSGPAGALTVRDRDYPSWLLRSGTWRAHPDLQVLTYKVGSPADRAEVFKSVRNSCPAALLPGLSVAASTMPLKIIPCISRVISRCCQFSPTVPARPVASRPGPQGHQARGPEATRQSYALRACHVRCSRGSKPARLRLRRPPLPASEFVLLPARIRSLVSRTAGIIPRIFRILKPTRRPYPPRAR
jgi:hypothetical protein